jgi:hypothetical protein
MADGTKIIIEDVGVHPDSGHILIKVRTVTTKGTATWKGPIKGYGVDANLFRHHFGSDVEQVKAYIRAQHLAYTGAHTDLTGQLMKLKGQEI